MLAPALLLLSGGFLPSLLAQSTTSCSNYGTLSGSTCDCPSGWGGPTCDTLLCGSSLTAPSARPAMSSALSGDLSKGCNQQCDSGFIGPTCSVPTSAAACSSARTTSGDQAILSTGAYVWSEGFVTCDVVNPTLQGAFPGTTLLDFQHVADSSFSLYPSTAPNGTMRAQLYYSPETGKTSLAEQFYCKADTCSQSNTTSTSGTTVDWSCQNLECRCIGEVFCGGGGSIDLVDTINGLSGAISVTCDASGASCAFKQSVLQTLFGTNGLSLNGCRHGECVQPSTINTLTSRFDGEGGTGGGGSSLSPGVIAGLAVVGAAVLILLALLVWGCLAQRKARRSPPKDLLEDERLDGAVGVRWESLGYALPSRARGLIPGRPRNSGRVILDNLSGSVEGGQLCAILGPTGAGKSTLVDLLAHKRKSGEKTGSVHFTVPEDWRGEKVRVGVVDQHDVLPPMSTVKEALQFAADLKMGEHVSKSEKSARVHEVLRQLGLLEVADSQIGGTERRGISGGERRRLSIGLELLAAPSVLICDEPTSGLDSNAAMRVVQVLKNLTSPATGRRTTVITTIHQPSTQIYYMFDHVILLGTGGRLLYNASARDVVGHFAAIGSPVPSGWNPADHLLDVASSPASAPSVSSSVGKEDSSAPHLRARDNLDRKISIAADGPATKIHSKPATVALTQFQVLARRELQNLRRDWSLVLMHTVVAVLVGLFVGGLYYQVNLTIGGFQSRVGSLFFLGSLLAFSSLSALSNFANVKNLFLRERANSYYSPFSWFASRVVLDIVPLRIVPTIIVSTIAYWMVGLAPDAAHFFKFLLVLVLYNITTTLWNLFLAAIIPQAGIAILFSAVINLLQMGLAGFFANISAMPPVFRWIHYVNPLFYTLEALAVNEVGAGLMIVDTLAGVKVQINAVVIMESLFAFTFNAYYRDVLILVAFLVAFALALGTTVVFKLKEVR